MEFVMKGRHLKKNLGNAFWKICICISAPLFPFGRKAR